MPRASPVNARTFFTRREAIRRTIPPRELVLVRYKQTCRHFCAEAKRSTARKVRVIHRKSEHVDKTVIGLVRRVAAIPEL